MRVLHCKQVVRIVRPKKARTGSKRPIEDKQRAGQTSETTRNCRREREREGNAGQTLSVRVYTSHIPGRGLYSMLCIVSINMWTTQAWYGGTQTSARTLCTRWARRRGDQRWPTTTCLGLPPSLSWPPPGRRECTHWTRPLSSSFP